MDKFKIEDLILDELRKMQGFIRVDETDVGRVLFSGPIDIGRLAERLFYATRLRGETFK